MNNMNTESFQNLYALSYTTRWIPVQTSDDLRGLFCYPSRIVQEEMSTHIFYSAFPRIPRFPPASKTGLSLINLFLANIWFKYQRLMTADMALHLGTLIKTESYLYIVMNLRK